MPNNKLLNKPQMEPVRRLGVLTGGRRRRPWTAAQKARIVTESHAVGATVCEVARRHALVPQLLYAWRRNVARADKRKRHGGELSFAPVVVTGPSQCDASATPAIEVVIGAVMVRIPAGVDPSTLQVVLRAVRATL